MGENSQDSSGKLSVGAAALHLTQESNDSAGATDIDQGIQGLDVGSLARLYDSLASDSNRQNVIKRLMVFLTCGKALGFSRCIFLEWAKGGTRLVYQASFGSIREDKFRAIAEFAASKSVADLLQNAPNVYDYEIDSILQDFEIDLGGESGRELLHNVKRRELRVSDSTPSSSAHEWTRDLAKRIGEVDVLTAPLRIENRVLGLFVVDRRWQDRLIGGRDEQDLGTFSQLAARILTISELQERFAHELSDKEWAIIAHLANHAFRNPLDNIRTVISNLESAVRNNNEAEALTRIQLIEKAVGRIQNFLNDLLLLEDRLEYTRSSIPLLPLLEEAKEQAQDSLAKNSVHLTIDCHPDMCILGNRARLLTCFGELIANSLNWIDKRRSENIIKIEAYTPDSELIPQSLNKNSPGYALIHFEDNGAGIEKNVEDKIFQPGFSMREEEGGTGMGLYIIKRTVEGHGGMISHYGRFGRGTTFAIFLPLAKESRQVETT